MNRHFVDIVKGFIKEKGLQDLSSEGWSRMRQVERDIESKKVQSVDEAISRFLAERDFSYTIGKNRDAMKELKKILERN